jgi:hypothetical protein
MYWLLDISKHLWTVRQLSCSVLNTCEMWWTWCSAWDTCQLWNSCSAQSWTLGIVRKWCSASDTCQLWNSLQCPVLNTWNCEKVVMLSLGHLSTVRQLSCSVLNTCEMCEHDVQPGTLVNCETVAVPSLEHLELWESCNAQPWTIFTVKTL